MAKNMTEDEEKYVTTAMLWYLPLMYEVRLRLD
jgi:predicted hydrolase (HD superfamily)